MKTIKTEIKLYKAGELSSIAQNKVMQNEIEYFFISDAEDFIQNSWYLNAISSTTKAPFYDSFKVAFEAYGPAFVYGYFYLDTAIEWLEYLNQNTPAYDYWPIELPDSFKHAIIDIRPGRNLFNEWEYENTKYDIAKQIMNTAYGDMLDEDTTQYREIFGDARSIAHCICREFCKISDMIKCDVDALYDDYLDPSSERYNYYYYTQDGNYFCNEDDIDNYELVA